MIRGLFFLFTLAIAGLSFLSPVLPVLATDSVPGTDVRVTGSQSQAEVTVALNPIAGNNLVGGYMELDPQGKFHLGHASTTNGGSTWQKALFPAVEAFDDQFDPVVAFDGAGKPFFVGLARTTTKCSGFSADSTCDASLFIAASSDSGSTWTSPSAHVVVRAGLTEEGNIYHDKPAMAIDALACPTCHNGRIFVSWTRVAKVGNDPRATSIYFRYSTDGGSTFPATTELCLSCLNPSSSAQVQTSSVAVAVDGTMLVSWIDVGTQKIHMVRSSDGGASFTLLTTVVTVATGSFTPSQQVAVERTDAAGVYIVYNEAHPTLQAEVKFTRSTDRGNAWSVPTTVNKDSAFGQILPAISTTPGRIDIIWYDGREFPLGDFLHVYYAKSTDKGQSFNGPNLRLSDVSISTTVTVGGLSPSVGHYIGIASSADFAFPVWTGKVVQQDERDMVFDKISFPVHPLSSSITSCSPSPAVVGQTVVCAASIDGGKATWTLTWAWGDGSPNTVVTTWYSSLDNQASHIYSATGTFTVTLTVTDSSSQSATSSGSVTVQTSGGGGGGGGCGRDCLPLGPQ